MKTFVFNDVEYSELNSLGVAFANEYNEALEALKDKKFLAFAKKFKDQKSNVYSILYETHYLQDVLTFLVYSFTEPKLLVIGGKFYYDFKEICRDLKTNPGFKLYLADKGFRRTIFNSLDDEKLKADLVALEENYESEFALDFIADYYNYDSIEDLSSLFESLKDSNEKYKTALDLFKDEEIQLHLAHSYGLAPVLTMREAYCPVFGGSKLIKNLISEEEIKNIFDNSFYWFLANNLKEYKYKNKAKAILKDFKAFQKEYKKKLKKNFDLDLYIDLNEKLHSLYLKFVNLYKNGLIVAKSSSFELGIAYCNTLVPNCYGDDKTVEASQEIKEEVEIKEEIEYNLEKLQKSIKNHKFFGRWLIFFSLLIGIYYGVASFVEQLKPVLLAEFGLFDILFIAGAAGGLIVGIFILIMKGIANSKYNKLCLLRYYRNNKQILTDKELKNQEKLLPKEKKYAKSIDRFYRFYGAIGAGLLALAISVLITGVLANFGEYIMADLATNASIILTCDKSYFIYLPALVVLLLGLIRHKKTAWSCIFAFLLSIILTIGAVYLVGMM